MCNVANLVTTFAVCHICSVVPFVPWLSVQNQTGYQLAKPGVNISLKMIIYLSICMTKGIFFLFPLLSFFIYLFFSFFPPLHLCCRPMGSVECR